MKEIFYPEIHSYGEIYNAFVKSEAAESLKTIYRWSTFRDGETDKEWVDALGPTANDFSHGFEMSQLAVEFLVHEKGRFTKAQQEKFILGLLVHDWGEPILKGVESVGDVSAQIKTEEHEKKESLVARYVINSLDLDQSLKEEMITAYHDVVEGGDPELNRYFKALETSEYVITAMHVHLHGEYMRKMGKSGIKNEAPMVGRVLVINLAKILETYAKDYPMSIGSYFKSAHDDINNMFRRSIPWLNSTKEWNGKQVDHKALAEDFKKIWGEFKKTSKLYTIRTLYDL